MKTQCIKIWKHFQNVLKVCKKRRIISLVSRFKFRETPPKNCIRKYLFRQIIAKSFINITMIVIENAYPMIYKEDIKSIYFFL